MRKICVVTGTRAEFGLLRCLFNEIRDDDQLELQIVATGMHLSPEFGMTYNAIEEAGFYISKKVEMLLSSDSPIGISKSIGLGVISFSEVLQELSPDIVVILGDRFEMLAVAIAAMNSRIPIGHIHGGETTEGAVDESIRHCITKMSHLHFTATEVYQKRVVQLGEPPQRVFNTGAPGLDNIDELELLGREEFEDSINFPLNKNNILVTFHPVTLEDDTSELHFNEILRALDELKDTHIIFTKPNADRNGRIIIKMIDDYINTNSDRARAFTSLGQKRYLSALKFVDAVVGNSSSGLIEAPSFKVATVNIGDRQKGRIKAKSVIDCEPKYKLIKSAILKALSNDFKKNLQSVKNPYGRGGTSRKIKEVLKEFDLADILKKRFFDVDFNDFGVNSS